MSQMKLVAFAVAFAMLPLSVRADDGPKTKEKKKEKEVVVKTEEKKTKVERGGNAFTNFWVHTVGGTIGNGLKSGARKIEKTFD